MSTCEKDPKGCWNVRCQLSGVCCRTSDDAEPVDPPQKSWLRQLFCAHSFKFLANIYGDQIISWGWNRSLWKCTKCGAVKARKEFHQP